MIFETERLYARPVSTDDAEAFFPIYSDVEVMRFLTRTPGVVTPVQSVEEMRDSLGNRIAAGARYRENRGAWALVRKDDERIIGLVMCKPIPDGDDVLTEDTEIGWHLGREFWGQGYATEAGAAVAQYAWQSEPELRRLIAVCYHENQPSLAVMHRLGMSFVGESVRYYGVQLDVYELVRPD